MEIHSMRIDHGPVQTNTMSYPQRQTPNHRPNHNQATLTADIYKPSRSPLSTARYPYPSSPQLQPSPGPGINQVQVSQRYQQQQPVVQNSAPPPVSPASSSSSASVPAVVAAVVSAPPPQQLLSNVYRDYRHNRISLLHPEYGPGGRAAATPSGRHGDPPPNIQQASPSSVAHQMCDGGGAIQTLAGQQPLKKIRLQDKEGMQPLRIDTRPGMYNPPVEAISPTLPDQMTQDDQTFRTTKDELIQQIGKVDRDIAKTESQIAILKKKKAELEQANKPVVMSEVEEDTAPKHQSLPQKIYAENRKKAQSAHAQLDSLGPKVEWPLYNQPSDAPIYHENKRRHQTFKRRLLDYFKKKHQEKEQRNSYLTETYSKMMQDWLRKVDKIESSTKRKAKEAKNREFFEKVFLELRKQREDKERFNRVGARVKSEADMEEIMDNLQEQALEDKKMRSYAVIPPILLDQKERKIKYDNHNGYIEDMEIVYKSRQFLNVWTPSEKEVFKEKYLQHPKNFGVIASYLDRKSVSDCIQYYYLSKKTENYKQLFRKARQRTRSSRSNTQKVNSSANASVVDILTTGVTTRLQREQQARTGVQQPQRDNPSQNPERPAGSSTPPDPTPGGAATPTPGAPTSSSSPPAAPSSNPPGSPGAPPDGGGAPAASTPPPPSTSANSENSLSFSTSVISNNSSVTSVVVVPTATTTTTSVDETKAEFGVGETEDVKPKLGEKVENNCAEAATGASCDVAAAASLDGQKASVKMENVTVKKEVDSPTEMVSDQNMTPNASLLETKKKKERRKEKDTAIETSDEETNNVQDKSIQGSCAVCQTQLGPQLHSRPLIPSQASQYGLREEQVQPNSRVCNTCRCKSVRSHYTHCPLPTCPNSRGRVKRLRSLPYRLQDLPSEVKEPILSEFRISPAVTKCCSACFNRIQRKLGPIEEWPEDEFCKLKAALGELGSNWQAIGERLNRPAQKVKMFCAANRKRLKGCFGEDRKPALSTDEESGSSTSSCEESLLDGDRHSSDTASAAESPPVRGGSNENEGSSVKRVDYDSSATETADEAQTTPDHYQGSATITPVTSGEARQNASPLSVKDLVLNVIEFSLMKNPGVQQQLQTPPVSGGIAPTISSILNNDSNEDVTIVSEYSLNNIGGQQRQQPAQQQQQQRSDLNLAKLVTPLIGATITPVTGPIQAQPPPEPIQSTRDDLIVLQLPDAREQPETLDLSIKKPREPPPAHSKHQQQLQQQQPQQLHRSDAYMYHQERKSPAFSIRSQPKLPSPKPANPKTGSITLGTPIVSQTRYEVLRQIPETKMGSITQGTPIQIPHSIQDKQRVYDYINKRGPMPGQQPQPQQQPYPGQYRPAAYTVEQQLSSRQIIMNDYITSQQMQGRRNDKPQYYPTSSPHRTPPPPQNQQPNQNQQLQQRQGVIQRHSRPQYLQPGHEALSTFVDLAVQQPSLPVPSAHEGLGKTMADNLLEQPHRYQIIQQHQQQLRQQQRLEEQRRAVAYSQVQQQQAQQQQQQQQVQQARQQAGRPDSNTLTAASLIDAIITHQINQTAEGGREVVSNAREPRPGDLLFQKFHPPSQGPDNGDRPPSVISVDVDGDGINKNLTVKELTDSVITHDFGARQTNYYHMQQQENMNEQWKRRMQQHHHHQQQQQQQQQHEKDKRSHTPQQQDERQIIRIAQPQKYHIERVEPVSPPDNNNWRYMQPPQPHISPLDYVKNRIVEVMRTEDDNKKEPQEGVGSLTHAQEKERSNSPGDMVIDEEKHENEFGNQQQQQQSNFYPYIHKESTANDNSRNNEPKPLLSAQYEPLSDED